MLQRVAYLIVYYQELEQIFQKKNKEEMFA
jgi:hypothetical protein